MHPDKTRFKSWRKGAEDECREGVEQQSYKVRQLGNLKEGERQMVRGDPP